MEVLVEALWPLAALYPLPSQPALNPGELRV